MWTTPETSWTTDDVVATTDANRIESNILHLYENTIYLSGSVYTEQSGLSENTFFKCNTHIFTIAPGKKIAVERVSHMLGSELSVYDSLRKLVIKALINGAVVATYECYSGTSESPVYWCSDKIVNEILYENETLVNTVVAVEVDIWVDGLYIKEIPQPNGWAIRLGVHI